MKIYIVSLIFLLTASAFALSDESPEVKIARLEAKIEQLEKTIDRAEKVVNNLEKQLAEQEKENKRLLLLCRKAGINTNKPGLQNDLNLDNKNSQAKRILCPLEIGQIVYFAGDNNLQVQQVIDTQNMIVELRIWKEDELHNLHACKQQAWVKGCDTSQYADDTIVVPVSGQSQLFKITGTVNDGVSTYFVLEPLIFEIKKGKKD
jgi:hypothetical protein